MFDINFNIQIANYNLRLLDRLTIHKSVYTLSNTAEIVLPASSYNRTLYVENKLKRGDKVSIAFAYDLPNPPSEFTGYLQNISINGGSITLQCEDEMFNLRKPLKNIELNNVELKELIQRCLNEINDGFTVDCSYSFRYKKFVIRNATAFDVLKKVQNETKASIYLKDKVLHIHPAETEYGISEYFDFCLNIEDDNLKYMRADERRYEVEVEGILNDGTRRTVLIGVTGGDRRSIKVYGVVDENSLRQRGNEELKRLSFTGYEGDIVTWLEPYVQPADCAVIIDRQYPERQGKYFIKAVTTTLSADTGGERKIELGIKLNEKAIRNT